MFYAFLCILCILIQGTMVEQLCLNGLPCINIFVIKIIKNSEVANSILAPSNRKEAYGIFELMVSQITGASIACSTVCRSKKTSMLRVTGLYEGNPPVTGGFPSQRASNAENVSIWWRHHDLHGSRCVLLVMDNSTLFLRDSFTGTGTILWLS